jgi:group I intron endonuclease
MSIGIYKITSPTNKIYIGQSINIERRYKEYSKSNCKNQTKLFLSIKKHGFENHKFEIIEECDVAILEERETYWKLFYKVLEIPSLCCRIDGISGYLSQETREKISKGLLGNIKSEATKKLISDNMPNKKKVYQFNIEGELLNIWDSIKEVERNFKGNIKNNILGKTKQAGGFIWLREEDKHKLSERVELIKNFIHPLKKLL